MELGANPQDTMTAQYLLKENDIEIKGSKYC